MNLISVALFWLTLGLKELNLLRGFCPFCPWAGRTRACFAVSRQVALLWRRWTAWIRTFWWTLQPVDQWQTQYVNWCNSTTGILNTAVVEINNNDNNNNNNNRLTAIFKENPRKPVPECLHSGFYWCKDDGGGSDNWSYKTCKAPVKSSPTTYIPMPSFFKLGLDPVSPNQQCQRTDGSVRIVQ